MCVHVPRQVCAHNSLSHFVHTESSKPKNKHLTLIPTPFCNKWNLGSEGMAASRTATRILLDHSSLEHLQGAENKNILRNKTKTPGNQLM